MLSALKINIEILTYMYQDCWHSSISRTPLDLKVEHMAAWCLLLRSFPKSTLISKS